MKSCERLHLTDDQRVRLTDVSGNLARAIAHLRDAWNLADPGNSRAIVRAIATLLEDAHSVRDEPELFRAVLGSVRLAIEVQAAAAELRVTRTMLLESK